MKKNEIIACLKANKNIDAYELTINHKDSRELFYVLKHLEINRAIKVDTYAISVYSMNKKGTGCSTVVVTAADNAASLTKKINAAAKKAKAASNKFYPLVHKKTNINDKGNNNLDLNDIACNVAKAIFKADSYKDGYINSTEIFVTKMQNEFINSNGVKHSSTRFKIEFECIPTWSNKKEEFELYKFYESNKIDYVGITHEVNEILSLARDRSNAINIKDIKLPKGILVLVKNDMRDLLVNNLCADLSYRSKYTKINHYEKGGLVSNNDFDLTLKANINGAVNSRSYDNHGVVLKNKKIISKGKVKDNHGDIQFGHYLGIKNISGKIPVCELNGKAYDYSKDKHLIIETFSSPQLEENSGYWGGECRLARYFDGKKYIPLTGLTISGNIYKDLKNIKFSKQKDVSACYKGPKYFIFNNIDIH